MKFIKIFKILNFEDREPHGTVKIAINVIT